MNSRIGSSLLCACLVPTAVVAQDEEKEDLRELNRLLVREIRLLREKLEGLEERLEKVEKRLEGLGADAPDGTNREPGAIPPELKKLFEGKIPFPQIRPKGADREALAEIEFPTDPTREQLVDYVLEICAASRGQTSYSSDDPQIGMLMRLGPENLDVLLELYEDQLSFYFTPAITALAEEKHKDQIIDSLWLHERLVNVVVSKGWEADAKEVLVRKLRSEPFSLPTEWIDAVAGLRDPKTYDDLVDYFRRGTNKGQTYEAIRSLPGIDLDAAVAEVWENRRSGLPFDFLNRDLAPIAMGHGHVDAMKEVFEGLVTADRWHRQKLREAIFRHTSARGSDEELVEWFEEHGDQLAWDAEKKKFVIRNEI